MLVLLLLAMGVVGAWGVLGARSDARRELDREFRLETEARARAVEAALASLRGDFLFLAQAPPIRDFPAAVSDPDPQRRRWSRIDSEASLLLFLEAHPEVERLSVVAGNEVQVAVGRRDGVPTLVPLSPVPAPTRGVLSGVWPIDPTMSLMTELSVTELLRIAVPGDRGSLELLGADSGHSPVAREVDGPFIHRAPIHVPSWNPPLELALRHSDPNATRADGLFRLVGRFRTTYVLLLVLAAIALSFGLLAFREVRRGAELEAHRVHEARIHDLERQVFHSDRLASVGRLAAGMAHEINNPLEGTSSYLSLLGDELAGGDPARAREYLAKSQEGLRRVAAVTRQVLTYSDPGRSPRQSVDLYLTISETAAFLRANPLPGTSAIEVESPATPLTVQGNPVTLGQLFLNLLLNASEATAGVFSPSGRAEAKWGPIRVGLARTEGQAVVTVRDHGPGIDPGQIDKIFEPFFSGRGSTGLGLSVCYGIVRDHGGEITASNDPSGGAVFTVRLPLEVRPGTASRPLNERESE